MERFEAFFGRKPVIAMVHLKALPGTPLYDGDLEGIVEAARKDLLALQEAGVDAVMFGNENDRPYELSVDRASVATMAYVIGRLKSYIRVPFGVDVLWDPLATMALAAATGARFAREIFTGLYGSDMSLWEVSPLDAMLAATALHHGLVLVTRNVRHFEGLPIALFNPWGGAE
jgi:membrane complex biogenesis BtpA family protein